MKHLLYISALAVFFSCKVDPKIVEALPTNNIREITPEGWPQPNYTFSVNTLSEDRFALGRALFYEPMLSKDNTISCGSCHQQFAAFAHAEHKFSHGINDLQGNRNAPGIFNTTWHTSFMHDGGINHIEVQPLGPITNPIEMAEDMNSVVAKLQASDKFRGLFKNAYGSEEVTTQKMFRSMAQFMGMMYSYNSKYDRYKRGETSLSEQETRGYELFLTKCNSCHKEPLFSDFQFRNNGLSVDPDLKDSGRTKITSLPTDAFRFKTPSLRNVEKTGPYMHDGRYVSLEQCLDHYTNNITNMVNIDPLLQSGSIPLTSSEKQDIISFLYTLTDYRFLSDKRFADPNFK
ncbi:MAG: cytochrome-c peroxidase [Bacteroidetes bacterium]|jgi:cytochrome c peroxidase|nr:cytochrome-c peroxidase [Bacteroidota bacterium]